MVQLMAKVLAELRTGESEANWPLWCEISSIG
jgi:hypothetical protein